MAGLDSYKKPFFCIVFVQLAILMISLACVFYQLNTGIQASPNIKKLLVAKDSFMARIFSVSDNSLTENSKDSEVRNHPTIQYTKALPFIKKKKEILKFPMDQQVHKTTPMKKLEGFLTSLSFWEQQTQGLLNFHQLQCLANHTEMRVVEPFLTDTSYSLYPSNESDQNLGKLMNMKTWNRELSNDSEHNYKHVVSWETLKKEAPKQLILHCIQYRQSGVSPKSKEFNGFQNGCTKKCYKQFDSVLMLLQTEGFKEVRRNCTNFLKLALHRTISLEEFKSNIFGKYHPSNVTVIFNEFRGIDPHLRGVRLPLHLKSPCVHTRRLPPNIIVPSKEIVKDAETYYKKYSNSENITIGIMARIEKIDANHHLKFSDCVDKAVKMKENLSNKHGLSESFLAMDVGKFGSTSNSKQADQTLRQGQTLFKSLYNNDWAFVEWEQMFSIISSTRNNTAYVANLQRTIAAKAACLILIGGGSFQEQAEQWHREYFHTEQSQQCVHKICT